MLRFEAHKTNTSGGDLDLGGGYCFGYDQTPHRADLVSDPYEVSCLASGQVANGLAMLWPAGSAGRLVLSTARLPDREAAYNLPLELLRGGMLRLFQKTSEWGLFDIPAAKPLVDELYALHFQFVNALKKDVVLPPEAADAAQAALPDVVALGEKLAMFHAEAMLKNRAAGKMPDVGAGVGPRDDLALAGPRVEKGLDFIRLHMPWRRVERQTGQADYRGLDGWVQFAGRKKIPLHAGPLICFQKWHLPEWVARLGGDYDGLRRLLLAHVQRTVERYAGKVSSWVVTSGLNANNPFGLDFDQLTELIKTACQVVRKADGDAQILLELASPWGEYLAANDRVIPPMLFADWATHSDVKFDAFSLQIYQGLNFPGSYVRDLFQVSCLLDDLLPHDRPVHVICQAPSNDQDDAQSLHSRAEILHAGTWRSGWTPSLQAQWLTALGKVAASKPAVVSITWRDIADAADVAMPHGGLCRTNMAPKPAHDALLELRKSFRKI